MKKSTILIASTSVVLCILIHLKISNIESSIKYKVVDGVYEDVGSISESIEEIIKNDPEMERHIGVCKDNIVKNICPEIQRLNSLVENFERTKDWDVLVRIGDMYARGCFPLYGPDEDSALRIYSIASRCPDSVVSSTSMSKFYNTRLNPLSEEDRMGTSFPKDTASNIIRSAENHLKITPLSEFMKCSKLRRESNDKARSLINRTHQDSVNRRNMGTTPLVPVPPREPDTIIVQDVPDVPVTRPRQPFQLDPQVVHSHSVSAAIRENIKSIVAEQGPKKPYDRVKLIDDVMAKLRTTGMKKKDEEKAFRVLVSLVPDKISSIGCSQIDVLNATVNKINSVKDEKVRNNLYESLGKNLASGVERGHVVCSTGRIGRIITTLEGVPEENLGSKIQKSIPMDVVRIEIASLASKIRTDVMAEASEEERTNYDVSDTSRLTEIMKNRFDSEVKKTYVEGLHLDAKIISPIADLYGSAF